MCPQRRLTDGGIMDFFIVPKHPEDISREHGKDVWESKRIRQEIYPHVIENMQTSAEGAQDFLDPPILPALVREVQRCDCLVGGCHCGGVHLNVRATAQRPQHFLEYDCMCTNASSKLCFSRHQACSLSTIPAPPLPLHHFWF